MGDLDVSWANDVLSGSARFNVAVGDALTRLRQLPDNSVQTVVTSPPYFNLRDYSTEPQVWGGDPTCAHDWGVERYCTENGAGKSSAEAFTPAGETNAERVKQARWRTNTVCAKCGAWRGELGREKTVDEYVAHIVDVFREVRRVLRYDGVLWLNLGDGYTSGGRTWRAPDKRNAGRAMPDRPENPAGLKNKDLIGVPWRVALALQADGWYLRCDVVWEKPNRLPESVTDRPTRCHEYVFLLAKAERYFYDEVAIREPAVRAGTIPGGGRAARAAADPRIGFFRPENAAKPVASTRHARSVWSIPTAAFPGAHFATFPPKLVERPLLAATSQRGACPTCGAPWERVVGQGGLNTERPQAVRALELFEAAGLGPDHLAAIRAVGFSDAGKALVTQDGAGRNAPETQALADEAKAALGGYYREFCMAQQVTLGWFPTCTCDPVAAALPPQPKKPPRATDEEKAVWHAERRAWWAEHGPTLFERPTVPCVVLDPFAGVSTTGLAALQLGRNFLGIELNPEYADWGVFRLEQMVATGVVKDVRRPVDWVAWPDTGVAAPPSV